MNTPAAAVFLDRDGVLVEDRDVLVSSAGFRILPGVPAALTKLKRAGFRLIVVSNQAVVARGLLSEQELEALHVEMGRLLVEAGAPPLDAVYFCPHHPEASLGEYRVACECRKPKPGMLMRAAAEHNLNLAASFMVGDRMTDIVAGARAGCRAVLVRTGKHAAPPIVAAEPVDASVQPDQECADLDQAASWILEQP
jgi:D-glycero-D-manno-heptose 1,7-bisphosphate phosphatase